MSFARHLRNNATPEERILWSAICRIRPRFTRQLAIGPFVADFACRRARIIVEIDGGQHVENAADARRTELLEEDGWRVLRFWNVDVRNNIDGIVEAIVEAIGGRLPQGEVAMFAASQAGRERSPRIREAKKRPPLAPPRSRGGE